METPLTEWYDKIEAADSVAVLEEIRIAVFGKKGVLELNLPR